MIKRYILIFGLICCLGAGNVCAEEFLLSKIVPATDVKLNSIADIHRLSIPVPERWKVREAVLKFNYVSSTALLPYKSRLVVSVDGIPLSQATLGQDGAEKEMVITVPGKMLAPGYHTLEFRVAQHSERQCEDPFAPELWTMLRLGDAKIDIDYSLRPIPLRLSAIPRFIEDPKLFPNGHVNLVLGSLDAETLQAAAIVAGGIGARFKYRPVHISVSQEVMANTDNIIIGTVDEVKRSKVPRETLEGGPRITIDHVCSQRESDSPGQQCDSAKKDARFALITISGSNQEELRRAATAFSSMNFPFPQGSSMVVEGVDFPRLKAYSRAGLLEPGVAVPFGSLGFSTHIFKGMGGPPAKFEFSLPPDLYIEPNQYAELYLHFGFSAALRQDSSLKLDLNGKPVASIHLDDMNGAFYERYKILIPTYLFRPGKNVISFHAVLMPLEMKRCELFQDMNLFLTLFDDSMISFPEMAHWGKMPEIGYFFDSGFPFSRIATCEGAAFFLADRSLSEVALAMNISAYLGQVNGIAPVDIGFVFDVNEAKGKDIIALGDISKMPLALVKNGPLVISKDYAQVRYPLFVEFSQKSGKGLWQKIEEKFARGPGYDSHGSRVKKSTVKMKGVTIQSDTAIIMEFESPLESGRTVLLFTGGSEKAFSHSARMLWSGRLKGMAHGDLVMFSADNPQDIYSLNIGPSYYTGKLSQKDRVDFLLRSYPWLFYGILASCFVVMAIIIAAYLRWRKKKRLANEI
ncbi:MAG: cellulose biosynthesis cyclic di-GMP-binding regulatory protein BcsB [Thermodesulfobacteria bacterium]|nr:cellulose biosynthesis cyclic di-GMP-binding regulatory protein BcsB [Thermodesulfobacteriota bacterium]